MSKARLYRKTEKELLAVASRVFQRRGCAVAEACPSTKDLRRFADGKERRAARRENVVAHLAQCDQCIDYMSYMRTRRIFMAAAMAATLVLGVVVSLWTILHRVIQGATDLAVMDLRYASPTRGDDLPGASPTKLQSRFNRLDLILPVGSTEGTYELVLYRGDRQEQPVLEQRSNATWNNRNLVIHVPLDAKTLQPGRYHMAFRHGESDWEYYPFNLE